MSASISLFVTFVILSAITISIATKPTNNNDIIFSGDATIIVSDADRVYNSAFNASLQDFVYDFYNVFGLVPLTLDPKVYLSEPCSVGDNTISVIYVGLFSSSSYPLSLLPNKDISSCYNGVESHCVRIVYDNNYDQYAMIAMSNDTLGAIYALFTISSNIFGIDPLYRFSGINGFDFTDYSEEELIIKNGTSLSLIFGSPSFEYRCIFNNDEDLLGGFGFGDEYGESVFSGHIFQYLFESLLRLKGNCMQIGTVTYPDEISIKLAAKRGIYIQAASHFNLLNSNTKMWPLNITGWEYQKYPMNPKFVWNASINALLSVLQIPADGIIWSVGYRGLWDNGAPCPGCSEQEKGLIISQVIGNMSIWLPKDSKMNTFMWSEGIGQLSNGYLKIPENVSIILTDNGNGYINDIDNFGNISEGIYIHTMMESSQSNQLTELTSPVRFFQQISKFTNKSKKNKYAIINTSDLKPVILSTSAVFCYLYNPNKCGIDGNDYILNWCLKRYLLKNQNIFDNTNYYFAKNIAMLYERYYNISYVFQGRSDENVSAAIWQVASNFINDIHSNGKLTNDTLNKISWQLRDNQTMQYLSKLYSDSMTLYTNDIISNLSQESIHLYETHILLQQSLQYHGNLAIYNIYYAALNYQMNNMNISLNFVKSALNNMQTIFKYCRKSEQYNNWKGLYYNSLLSDFQRSRSMIKRLKSLVQNGYKSCLLPTRPYTYYTWYNYQYPQRDNYPLFHYNSSYHFNTYIRIYCINTGNEINNNESITNCCINNVNGGMFTTTNGCNAMVEFTVLKWNQCKAILYTLNGLIPTQNNSQSMVKNNRVINITKSTHIQARCQYLDATLDSQITSAYFQQTSSL